MDCSWTHHYVTLHFFTEVDQTLWSTLYSSLVGLGCLGQKIQAIQKVFYCKDLLSPILFYSSKPGILKASGAPTVGPMGSRLNMKQARKVLFHIPNAHHPWSNYVVTVAWGSLKSYALQLTLKWNVRSVDCSWTLNYVYLKFCTESGKTLRNTLYSC